MRLLRLCQSTFLDSDGTPHVFYHNTPNVFTTFDAARNGTHNDAGWLGDGFYFYGIPNEGNSYGEHQMRVFLDIRNPYYATADDVERLAEANNREESLAFRQRLEDEGYDGVYYDGDLRQEAVAFYPNQIKSAEAVTRDGEGNVIPLSERFDPKKEDIRYAVVDEGGDAGVDVDGIGLSLEDAIAEGLLKLRASHADNMQHRLDALTAIAGRLDEVRRAMWAQRRYDRRTVGDLMSLAQAVHDLRSAG